MKPNIFSIATKELSHDGFFTWLIQWADIETAKHNKKLHETAQEFVRFLLCKNNDFLITTVETERQWKKIDILAKINKDILIIIEDKTETGEHSDQLNTYKEHAQELCKAENRQLICIYLKTGSEPIYSRNEVLKKGYEYIGRAELLEFFNKYQTHEIDNDIYSDFVDRINDIENSEKSYETQTIKEWHYDSWKGFYQYLDETLEISSNGNYGHWEYVPNAAGGFLGFWWYSIQWKGYSVYLQIEQGDLCFKIEVHEKDKRNTIRNEWHDVLIKQAQNENRAEIRKPDRFGKGKNMTVAIVSRENWLGADGSILDKEKVIGTLKEYETFLNRCVKN